uniref:Homeobox domain-containing protein n=1 Tax=Mastacembelus armatus TaxID=205130 RepID=A0A7N8X6X1_9TELE
PENTGCSMTRCTPLHSLKLQRIQLLALKRQPQPSHQHQNQHQKQLSLTLKPLHPHLDPQFPILQDKDSPYNFNNPPTTVLEESREELAQNQPLTLSPCSLSPGFPANTSPQPQTTDSQRVETQRCRRSSRTRFTEQQLETLQGVFEATPYPREEEYDRLSALLSLPNRVIVVWFQNARQRARKNQDRGTDDGFEGKNEIDNIQRRRNDCYKNDDDDDNNKGNEAERAGYNLSMNNGGSGQIGMSMSS